MSTISRVRRRFSEDGLRGLSHAFFDRIIAPIHVQLVSRDGTYLIEQDGIKINLASTRIQPLVKYRMKNGSLIYEVEESSAISAYLNPNIHVIELGAGVGFISCLIDRKLSESEVHVAVEANPELIPVLKQNHELNNAGFEIRHAAYSPNDEAVTLNIYHDFRGSGIYNKAGKKTNEEITVEGINLASLVEEFDIDRFTLVSDIEGVEAHLILEEWDILESHCDTLILEFHNRNPETPKAKSRLSDSGFERIYSRSDVEVWTH